MNPFISIIIPVFNAEKYIQQTLDSLFAQTYTNFEIIVVDDGSTDNSKNILEKSHGKIILYSIQNSGVSHARNFAVQRAKGEWLAFIDADDIWLPEKLEAQLSSIDTFEWSHTNSFYIGDNHIGNTKRSDLTKQIGGNVFEALIIENFITTSTVLLKRSLFMKYSGFDESMEALEDWKLWIQIAKNHPLAYQSEPLAEYRVYDGSTSRKARRMISIHEALIAEIFRDIIVTPKMKRLKRKALTNSYTICSYIAEDSCEFSLSFSAAIKAWRHQPFNFQRLKRILTCFVRAARQVIRACS